MLIWWDADNRTTYTIVLRSSSDLIILLRSAPEPWYYHSIILFTSFIEMTSLTWIGTINRPFCRYFKLILFNERVVYFHCFSSAFTFFRLLNVSHPHCCLHFYAWLHSACSRIHIYRVLHVLFSRNIGLSGRRFIRQSGHWTLGIQGCNPAEGWDISRQDGQDLEITWRHDGGSLKEIEPSLDIYQLLAVSILEDSL